LRKIPIYLPKGRRIRTAAVWAYLRSKNRKIPLLMPASKVR
jgi:hypothetical protein